jgi:hypothetical protein
MKKDNGMPLYHTYTPEDHGQMCRSVTGFPSDIPYIVYNKYMEVSKET